MSTNKKRGIIIGIILVLLFLFIYARRNPKQNQNPPPTHFTQQTNPSSPPTETIKCQNVVVTPSKTVELFTYQTGSLSRAIYRVSAMKEEDAVNLQILSDGTWLYVWNEPRRFNSTDAVTNPPGKKMRLGEFPLKIIQTDLDQVARFSAPNFSGDKLCYVWDDVDPVFEVPKGVEFEGGDGAITKVQDEVKVICDVCAKQTDDALATTCRTNLSCL